MSIEERVERVLAKLKLRRFYPFPFARSGYLQTIYGTYWPILKPSRPDRFHHIQLADGDVLVAAENRPPGWRAGARVMLLVHGLTGSFESTYMQRTCRRMNRKGYLVLRLNLRHCGPGAGLARRPYHAGVSDDTRAVLEWIKLKFPGSPVTQIGFSLGGNVTLKMAGEDGAKPTGNLDSVVAISPPVDLGAAGRRMSEPANRVFERSFVRALARDVERMRLAFPDLEPLVLPPAPSLRQFEEAFATRRAGFATVADYHRECSSLRFIPAIKIPTLILCAADDPVVDGRGLARISHAPGGGRHSHPTRRARGIFGLGHHLGRGEVVGSGGGALARRYGGHLDTIPLMSFQKQDLFSH